MTVRPGAAVFRAGPAQRWGCGLAVLVVGAGIASSGNVIFLLAFLAAAAIGWTLTSPAFFTEWIYQHAVECRTCTRCAAPLDGLPDQGNCPECGETYHLTELRRAWRAAYPIPPSVANPDSYTVATGLVAGRGPRRTRVELFATGMMVAVAWTVAGVLLLMTVSGIGDDFRLASMPATMMATMLTIAWRSGLRKRRIVARDFRECTRCGFDLRGLASPGACPECGRRFTDRALWAYWLLRLKIGPTIDLETMKRGWLASNPQDGRPHTGTGGGA